MNETRRDDIYQFDDAEIAEHPIVQRMVRDAVAARDAEIREALLSDGALVVVENARFFDENSRELVMRQIRHIGLHGDGAGG